MPGDLRAHMRLTADAKGFVGEVRVAGDQVARLSRAMGRGEAPARSYARATAEVEQATSRARRSFLSAHSAVLRYVGGIASVAGLVSAARGTIRYADAHTQVANAARLAAREGLPRPRGDGPLSQRVALQERVAPPPTRGWTGDPVELIADDAHLADEALAVGGEADTYSEIARHVSPTSPTRRGFCRFSFFSATQVIELLESDARNRPRSSL